MDIVAFIIACVSGVCAFFFIRKLLKKRERERREKRMEKYRKEREEFDAFIKTLPRPFKDNDGPYRSPSKTKVVNNDDLMKEQKKAKKVAPIFIDKNIWFDVDKTKVSYKIDYGHSSGRLFLTRLNHWIYLTPNGFYKQVKPKEALEKLRAGRLYKEAVEHFGDAAGVEI